MGDNLASAAFVSVKSIWNKYDKILSIFFLIDKHFRILLVFLLVEKVCDKSTRLARGLYGGAERH